MSVSTTVSGRSNRPARTAVLLTGLALGATLGLTACGGNDSAPTSSPASTPAAATATTPRASAPVAASQVSSCLNGTGLYIGEIKEKSVGARFGADAEI